MFFEEKYHKGVFMKKIVSSIFIFVFLLSFFLCPSSFVYADSDISLNSKSCFLMDYASEEVLFAKNEKEHLPIASMVKMMTILIALEEYDEGNVQLETKISTTENASGMGGSQVFIDPYVEYSFEDLLKSCIIASANDASVALAEYFNGNEKSFTNRMNKKAKELGMLDTNYMNSTGLPAPEQYSSAKDCAILMREVLKHELYHKYSSIWMDELIHPSGRKTELVNTNKLIRYFEGCDGGKTGSTNEAGCCLTASAKRGDMRLISVVIGAENSKTRFNESSLLLNYGFANFENKSLVNSTTPLLSVKIQKGKVDSCDVFALEDFSTIVRKGDETTYETSFHLPDSIKAPLENSEKIGKVCVTKNGTVIKEIDLVVKEDIKHISYFDSAKKVIENW